jgi:hypothetical protein
MLKIFPSCKDCGKKLSRLDAQRCKPCSLLKQKGKRAGNYIDGHSLKKPNCPLCSCKLKSYISKYCRKCADYLHGLMMKGNKFALIHGKCYLPYPFNWRFIRIEIRNKYSNKCVICNKSAKDVHHIDYNKQNCSESNLILLCHKCHCKTNTNRDYWYAYFRYLIEIVYTN